MQARKLRLMISSRCRDEFPVGSGNSLSDVRRRLKSLIETDPIFQAFGENIFDVWINESEPPQGSDWNSTDVCLNAVRMCDVLLCLSNDNAGWAAENSSIGICHAELLAGLRQAPSKVKLIRLDGEWPEDDNRQQSRNLQFKEFLEERKLFRGSSRPDSEESLAKIVRETLLDTIVKLSHFGVREAHRGGGPSGQSLEWNRLQFSRRQKIMENALRLSLLERPTANDVDGQILLNLHSWDIILTPNAIPDSLTVSEALELVGRPFLRDHLVANALNEGRGGPVHIIACFKNATETQARKLLGFPDATVVPTPFGIWVADGVQKVQFAFITACSDEQNTKFGVQKLFEWLEDSGEDVLLADRAQSRARIVQAIAREVQA